MSLGKAVPIKPIHVHNQTNETNGATTENGKWRCQTALTMRIIQRNKKQLLMNKVRQFSLTKPEKKGW